MVTTVPSIVRKLFPHRIWNLPGKEKNIYLTFDDGPVPEVTPWVLKQLKKYDAKATFFCIGDNIRKHPEIFEQLVADGHSTGNHTFHHLNGWKTPAGDYLKNALSVEKAVSAYRDNRKKENLNSDFIGKDSWRTHSTEAEKLLFRPPYGRITGKQARLLQHRNYKIIMWDVLSRDYDKKLSAKKCFKNVIKHTKAGSIIVFHDSLKAEKNMKSVLPLVLEYYSTKGYTFKKI